MPTDRLTFADGEIKLGNDVLPGILVSITVSAGVKFDRAERDHMSGKTRTPLGWEDADIKVVLDLLTDGEGDAEIIGHRTDTGEKVGIKTTCYGKLTIIDSYFKGNENKPSPRIYDIAGSHFYARDIKQVVFSGLQSEEDDQSDVIRATLAFSEYLPVVVRREQQANAQKKATGTPAVKPKPAKAPAVADTVNPFMAGINAGLE